VNVEWQAIARELALSVEQIAHGVQALDRASFARPAEYSRAFFGLSVGLERLCKMTIALDHAVDNNGAFPPSRAFKTYGHDLKALLDNVDVIAGARNVDFGTTGRPATEIHESIVKEVSQFADNVTRYYNLELLSGTRISTDPIARWWTTIREPILAQHLTRQSRAKIERCKAAVQPSFGEQMVIRSHAETGEEIRSAATAVERAAITSYVIPWERMYVLQLVRYVATVTMHLNEPAMASGLDWPYVSEFLGAFRSDDKWFRKKKMWSLSP
jgi:hypothetical protein